MNQTALTWADFQPALPEIYLTAAICVLLLADVFFGHKSKRFTPTFTLLLLAGGAVVTALFANVDTRVIPAGLGESYVADPLAVLLKLFGFLTIALALLYSREYLERRGMMRGEYYVLSLTALLGIFVLCSANSLLTVYIGVELMSLSLYAAERGFLTDVEVAKVGAFEQALIAFFNREFADLMAKINVKGDFNDEIDAGLKAGIEKFKATQSW